MVTSLFGSDGITSYSHCTSSRSGQRIDSNNNLVRVCDLKVSTPSRVDCSRLDGGLVSTGSMYSSRWTVVFLKSRLGMAEPLLVFMNNKLRWMKTLSDKVSLSITRWWISKCRKVTSSPFTTDPDRLFTGCIIDIMIYEFSHHYKNFRVQITIHVLLSLICDLILSRLRFTDEVETGLNPWRHTELEQKTFHPYYYQLPFLSPPLMYPIRYISQIVPRTVYHSWDISNL